MHDAKVATSTDCEQCAPLVIFMLNKFGKLSNPMRPQNVGFAVCKPQRTMIRMT
jgi:hypothetical protein